ncbi:MAG: anhydro-N-acetylmuramic acid kinase [Chryseolinea sp.]
MNKNISQLARIANKKKRRIIGLMSGTSMDGLDVALCEFSGKGLKTTFELLEFETVPYNEDTKEMIIEVFAKKEVDFEKLCILNPWIGLLHAKLVTQCLKKWKYKPEDIDIIASHGQTVLHSPSFLHPDQDINATFQIGDGDHVAVSTGIITISDFRQKHIAKGGEGAPLAVYGDFLLLSDKKASRILLNIGGIANFTYLPAGQDAKKVFVTDTGPGNTLIDQAIRQYCPGEYFDKDARRALAGRVNGELLSELLSDPFFKLPFPKTTGPELFNMDYIIRAQKKSNVTEISLEDLLATLTRFSAESIVMSVKKAVRKDKFDIYLSGGGAHNPLLTRWIQEMLGLAKLRTTEELGVPGDAKEAILFAVLGNESLVGGDIDFGKRARIPSVCMGKYSFPR